MKLPTTFSIFPLGDSALTLDLGNIIDIQHNKRVIAIQTWLEDHRFTGLNDIIVSYGSVSVFFDPVFIRLNIQNSATNAYSFVKAQLETAWFETEYVTAETEVPGPIIRIPVCYERAYGPDLEWVAQEKYLHVEELIELHTGPVYHIYMMGFLPGFPYMGRTDSRLAVSRRDKPVAVSAGGVAIAGNQTGIYPLNSPGGWRVIGRSPVRLFDPAGDPPVLLRAGYRVQFYPVSSDEFLGWKEN